MPISKNRPPPAPPAHELCTPPPPADPSSLKFNGPPVRRILTLEDQALFQQSPTHSLILSFVKDLNASVYNLPNNVKLEPLPQLIQQLSNILDKVEGLVESHPPEDAGGSRFGNKAFRGFYDAVWDASGELHNTLGLPGGGGGPEGAIEEVKRYFCEMFGNRTRIDYGSGHELNWLSWVLCFRQLGMLQPEMYPAVVLRLFLKYLRLMRLIQTTYYLEPAGSHGVWGLDDYQFLPFLFGSAQLYSHAHLRPKCIHDEDVLEEYKDTYIYLGCIAFINSIKTTAGLRWHSPMLDDISSALNWGKINNGMIKMYEKEVLGKLPIMQHFLFGTLIPAVDGMSKEEEEGEEEEGQEKEKEIEEVDVEVEMVQGEKVSGQGREKGGSGKVRVHTDGIASMQGERKAIVIDRDGMRHVHSTWGECCGIKIPSAIGAREETARHQLRKAPRIPFD